MNACRFYNKNWFSGTTSSYSKEWPSLGLYLCRILPRLRVRQISWHWCLMVVVLRVRLFLWRPFSGRLQCQVPVRLYRTSLLPSGPHIALQLHSWTYDIPFLGGELMVPPPMTPKWVSPRYMATLELTTMVFLEQASRKPPIEKVSENQLRWQIWRNSTETMSRPHRRCQ